MADCHESSLVKLGGEWTLIESAEVTRARTALDAESRFVAALLDAATVLVFTVDRDGTVIRCNSQCEAFTGISRSQIEGGRAWEAFAMPAERVVRRIEECWDAGGTNSFESMVRRHDGRETHVAWSTAGIHDTDGELRCLVVTGQDVTEHKAAERRLQEAYELEHRIAASLQESLLRPVPDIPGVSLGVVYKPAVEAERVGGDFYDVFTFGEDRLAVVVGDVSGKGVTAAGMTETVRSTMRALLFMGLAPGEALTRAGEMLLGQTRSDQFVTIGVALLDRATGHVWYASAGQPPPIVVDATSEYAAIEQGVPLGTFVHEYETTSIQLDSSQSLVLYTDGLSEARSHGQFFGQSGLLDAALRNPHDPVLLVADLLESAEAFSAGSLADDIAIVALRLEEQLPQ